jgi:hypothetical protein
MLIHNAIYAVLVGGSLCARGEDTHKAGPALASWLAKEASQIPPAKVSTPKIAASCNVPKMPMQNVKVQVTLEYQLTPPASAKELPHSLLIEILPRVGSSAWIKRVAEEDRDLLAAWELRRLQTGSVIEDRPSANDFTGRWR